MSGYSDYSDVEPAPCIAAYDYFEHVVQQNKRDDESRVMPLTQKLRLQAISYSETCARCGKDLKRVFQWNGKKLCKGCMEAEQGAWVIFTGGPNAAPQRVQSPKAEREVSRMDSLISEFLAIFHLKWIEEEMITEPKLPVSLARLLSVKDKKQMPEAEGIMNKRA